MKQTRFMQVMFSAVERGDEELAKQVSDDIEAARVNGEVDTDEVTYTNLGEGKVMIIDKENGEATIAEVSPEEAETYDLIAVPEEEMEKFLHPMECGVTPDPEVVTEEHENVVPDHMDGVPVSQAIADVTVEENACPCEDECEECEDEEEEKTFSVYTENTAVIRLFNDQEFCERLFSEVLESEETATVGNIKVEKCDDEDNSVVITDTATGDQAKVEIDGENGELEVTELSQKEFKTFSEEVEEDEDEDIPVQQYDPLFVVGIDPVDHVIVDAPVYDEDSAQILAQRLSEIGVMGVQIFQNPDEARAHAFALLEGAGVDLEGEEVVEEPVEKEFSDCSVYVTRYYSDYTTYMLRLFSEAEEEDPTSQDAIEDAIETGEQIENDTEIITPVDNKTAIIEDKSNGEFTKAVLTEDEVEVSKISEEEADELTKDLRVEETDPEEDEVEDDSEERTYSSEEITRYQLRLFSDLADQDDLEKALDNKEVIENEDEVITPVGEDLLVVEDKKTGEFTKISVKDEEFDTEKISEEDASKFLNNVVENNPESEDNSESDEEKDELEENSEIEDKEASEEKEFSDNEAVKFFTAAGLVGAPAPVQQPALQPVAQTPMLDANGNVVAQAPVQQEQPVAPEAASVEVIEDKALQAVAAIQEAAVAAQQKILAAKEAPVQAPAGDLREATFSDSNNTNVDDILGGWLSRI